MNIVTNARGEAIAIGECSSQELLAGFPAFKKEFLAYQPDSTNLIRLKSWSQKTKIFTILGTWCSDSRREVPRLIKIITAAENRHIQLRFLCVDRSKRDLRGIAAAYNIQFVPTMIVLCQGKEIGRIIEKPKKSLEDDLIQILAKIDSSKK